jgi:hypothetical protein
MLADEESKMVPSRVKTACTRCRRQKLKASQSAFLRLNERRKVDEAPSAIRKDHALYVAIPALNASLAKLFDGGVVMTWRARVGAVAA